MSRSSADEWMHGITTRHRAEATTLTRDKLRQAARTLAAANTLMLFVARLLEPTGRGDGTAVSRIFQDYLQGDAGRAWLQSGRERLHDEHAIPHVPEQVESSHQPEALAR